MGCSIFESTDIINFHALNMSQVQSTSNEPCARSVYLITYSQADIENVPDKDTFIALVTDGFHHQGTARIIQFACAQERHQDGNVHYHIVVKLNKQKRWRAVRNYISRKYNINVNFSNEFSNYYDGISMSLKMMTTYNIVITIPIYQTLPVLQELHKRDVRVLLRGIAHVPLMRWTFPT